jgi:tetratricopeptide (TPR) repeat protein
MDWASTQYNMGITYRERLEGERRANLEQAIVCYEAALQVCTRDALPKEWASIQHDLGIAYLERFEGERKGNLERAIACYEAALQIRTPAYFPNEWGVTQLYLGMTYGSANRDEGQFPHAEQFEMQRAPNHHLAFGYGIHFCVGAFLARKQGQIALEALCQRLPTLRLAPGQTFTHAPILRQRGFTRLQVVW